MPKADLVAEVRERHTQRPYQHSEVNECEYCDPDEGWPCDAIQLADEAERFREALRQSACDLSVASSEILNLFTHSERERVAADRVAQFCHSQSGIARAALHTEADDE